MESAAIVPTVPTAMGMVAAVLLGVWGIVARYDSRMRDHMEAQRKETNNRFDVQRKETSEQAGELRDRIDAQGKETAEQIGQLRERMAKLEELLEGLREAVTGKAGRVGTRRRRRARRVVQSGAASRHAFALVGVCALTFFVGLDGPALTDSDEAFYAESAREMIERGDWLPLLQRRAPLRQSGAATVGPLQHLVGHGEALPGAGRRRAVDGRSRRHGGGAAAARRRGVERGVGGTPRRPAARCSR